MSDDVVITPVDDGCDCGPCAYRQLERILVLNGYTTDSVTAAVDTGNLRLLRRDALP